MQNLFSIDQLFAQIFPWLSGISWDLGTVLTAIVFLWFLVLGFDWLKIMLLGNLERRRYDAASTEYLNRAEIARGARDTWGKGTKEWLHHDLLYKEWVRKSVNARMKGWR